jgi:hypothetical protein
MNICRWTDEETDDNVLGSGADMWDWYLSNIKWNAGANTYVVTMMDPEDEDNHVEYQFTRGKVRSTVTDMTMGNLPVNDRIRGYAQKDDMDADSMDCVVQWIVYGEIVYG